ncbi:MAG: PAS domain S-box protein, partial [Ignavibacteriae bacterium]|nr:PAS domain S-box protein [Ignavibacteriota bacterium]
MNYQNKSKEELIKELQELHEEHNALKTSFEIDIIGRKKAEEALRESEEKFKLLVTQMKQGLALHEVIYDNTGKVVDYRFIELNESFEKQTGLRREEVLGKTVLEVLPNIEPYWIEKYGEVTLTGKLLNYENYSKDMGKYYEVIAYRPKEHQFAVIINDITEHKLKEELLRESLAKYQVLFDSFPLGITISDKDGNIIESNQIAEKLLGLSKEEQLKRQIHGVEWNIIKKDGTPFPNEEFASVKALKENRVVENIEMGIVKGENDILWINVTAAPILIENYGVVITYSDISERKRTESALLESEKNLRKTNAEKDKFFSIIAHDLRSPFNGFLGLTEIMAEGLQNLTLEEIQKIAVTMRKSAANLYSLLGNLLEWSRMQRGLIPFEPKLFLLMPEITESMVLVTEAADKKEIAISYDIPED